jgi:hypoxanthine phosphoribosyltransferase
MSDGPKTSRPTVLLSEEQIRRRVCELAAEIAGNHPETDELVCLGVLKGSVFFLVDLVRALPMPVAIDFVQTSSYGSASKPGEVSIKKDVDLSLAGRDVLVVEDVVDTGHTLARLLGLLRLREPRSLELCALLDKPDRREVAVSIDYLGFSIPDRFVVGYGLDHAERWRNLPYVGIVDV